MEFYFLAGPPDEDATVRFDVDESRHIVRSRRHRAGDRVQAVDGLGGEYDVELTDADERGVRARVLGSRRSAVEPAVRLTLAQGVLKGDRLAEVVEAATQLGASAIQPFRSARTVGSCGRARVERLRKVALEAMKCSRRAVRPQVGEPVTLEELAARCRDFDQVLVAWEDERERPLADVMNREAAQVLLVVGPEGGLEEREVGLLRRSGAASFSLGPRTMRAEVAATVAVSALMYARGELAPRGKGNPTG